MNHEIGRLKARVVAVNVTMPVSSHMRLCPVLGVERTVDSCLIVDEGSPKAPE